MLDRVRRIPLGARLAIGALAVAAASAGTIANDRNGDGADEATKAPTYRGPSGGGHSWMPSLARRRPVVWAVGDAADGGATGRAVAAMVASHRVDRLLYLGDVYETGTAAEFASNYRPLYGRFDAITAPTIGNHEWPNLATGYVPYWTAARGTPPPLRYAFTVSGWQLISLNSNLPTDSAQDAWLSAEIRRTPRYGTCRIAFMHHPRYSAGLHGDLQGLEGMFEELRGHASIALAGHDHDVRRRRRRPRALSGQPRRPAPRLLRRHPPRSAPDRAAAGTRGPLLHRPDRQNPRQQHGDLPGGLVRRFRLGPNLRWGDGLDRAGSILPG